MLTRAMEVEIDDHGTVRPTNPADSLPHGRALLVWPTDPIHETALLSETSLAVDWLRPEEDEAWSRMEIADNGLAFFPANGRVLTPEMVKAAFEDEERQMLILEDGLPFFPSTGRVITSDMVKAAQDDDLG